jgi:hypothetical protein
MIFQIVVEKLRTLTPAFAAGLKRSGKSVQQHALVRFFLHLEYVLSTDLLRNHEIHPLREL